MKIVKININSGYPSPMKGSFWTKVLVMALAIFITSLLFDIADVHSPLSAIVAAIVISLLNAFLRPLLLLISVPLIVMSLGLFSLVINALIILLTSYLVKGFHVDGLWDAILFSIIVTIISFLLDLPQRIRKTREMFAEKEDEKEDEGFTDYEDVTEEEKDKEDKTK